MIVIGIVGSVYFQNLGELNTVILNESSKAIEFAISLAGIMAFWMGIMNIARDSGLIEKIGEKLSPIMKKLFPSVPKGHKAMSYMVMNMALNMLGAGNGATAFGLKAMNELQTLNKNKDTASNDMIMFLVINISSIQIIPFTMLKIRADAGSQFFIEIITCKVFQGRNKR